MATAGEGALIAHTDDENVPVVNSVEELLEKVRGGGELIANSGVVAHALEDCGFEIKEQNDDGSEFILGVKGEHNDGVSEPIGVAMETAEVPGKFKSGSTSAPSTEPRREFKFEKDCCVGTASEGQEVEFFPVVSFSSNSKGVKQRVFVDVNFQPAHTRSSAAGSREQVNVELRVTKVEFGVEGCIQTSKCLGHFVYQIDITVRPANEWKDSSELGTVRPGHEAGAVQHERMRGREVGITGMGHGNKPNAQFNLASGTATGRSGHTDGWLQAEAPRNNADKSVKWTWVMKTWDNGDPFDPTSNWPKMRSVPKLPFQNPEKVPLVDLDSQINATWTVPRKVANKLASDESDNWDVEVTVHTKVVQPQFKLRAGISAALDVANSLLDEGEINLGLRRNYTAVFKSRSS